jgi:hypothetical protein
MVGQDKVLLQLQRNGPTRRDNSLNTDLGRCSGLQYGSERARPGLQATWAALPPRLTPMFDSIVRRVSYPLERRGFPITASSTENH